MDLLGIQAKLDEVTDRLAAAEAKIEAQSAQDVGAAIDKLIKFLSTLTVTMKVN